METNPQNLPAIGQPGTPPSGDRLGHVGLIALDEINLLRTRSNLERHQAYGILLAGRLAACEAEDVARLARVLAKEKAICDFIKKTKGLGLLLLIFAIPGDSRSYDSYEYDPPAPGSEEPLDPVEE